MYPENFYSLFPAYPKEEKVFVAMSFDPKFNPRWEEVIKPAIEGITSNDTTLQPIRVDNRNISDSILTEILSGIGNSRFIFADLTTMGTLNGRPVRNSNVMYEIGIAHSTRLPEEVVLFRSDNDPLPFDTASVRVNSYDPDGAVTESIDQVRNVLISASKEIKLKQNLAVQSATDRLDELSWYILIECIKNSSIGHPEQKSILQMMSSISSVNSINRLLDMGAIKSDFPIVTKEMLADSENQKSRAFMKYKITEFGMAILAHGADRFGFFSQDVIDLMEEHIKQDKNRT